MLRPPDRTALPAEDLVSNLARRAEEAVKSLIDPGARVALLDFPMYANVGDSAIWIGTRLLLKRLGARVVYMADAGNYSPLRLARRLRGGTILLQGGGNFGDLWPRYERFREAVIAAFPGHRIIQLPQTLRFRGGETLARAQSVLNRHPNLILMLRDPQSLEYARREFGARSILCPDLALVMGRLSKPRRPDVDVVALRRGDLEASDVFPDLRDVAAETVDWTAEPSGYAGRLRRALERLRGRAGTVALAADLLVHPYDLLARQRLAFGCRLLSRGRVVLTDRLHGHLLSLLLDIPHVLVDDRYGKLRSFYGTWTRTSPLASWASSAEEARVLAISAAARAGA